MPPKAKFTKEEITKTALQIVREDGLEKLTARALAKKLGSSACPIFTVFENMEEVQFSVLKAAKAVYKEYIRKGLSEPLAFKGVGIQYITFALKEPKLFQLLFMSENTSLPDFCSILPFIDENYEAILSSILREYPLQKKDAERLYQHLWIYTHGIATLCTTKTCCFSKEEIDRMITEIFKSLLKNIR